VSQSKLLWFIDVLVTVFLVLLHDASITSITEVQALFGVMHVCHFVKGLLREVGIRVDGLVVMKRLLETRLGHLISCWCLRTTNDIYWQIVVYFSFIFQETATFVTFSLYFSGRIPSCHSTFNQLVL
jgi:hypothetical protein